MKFTVKLNSEGDIQFWSQGNKRVIVVPACITVGMGLFDETRPGFSYERDGEITALVCEAAIMAEGYQIEIWDSQRSLFRKAIRTICEPGGPFPEWPTVKLIPTTMSN